MAGISSILARDPYLASIMAANWVKACSAQGSIPTIKHFAANNQEMNRKTRDAQADERTMHEIYLPAFKKAVTEGAVVAVMCSYNRLNNVYASANDWLLNQTLKKVGIQRPRDVRLGRLARNHGRGKRLGPGDAQWCQPQPGKNPDGHHQWHGFGNERGQRGASHPSHLFCARLAGRGLETRERRSAHGFTGIGQDRAGSSAEEAIVLLKNDRETLPRHRAKVKTIVVVGPNASSPDEPAGEHRRRRERRGQPVP